MAPRHLILTGGGRGRPGAARIALMAPVLAALGGCASSPPPAASAPPAARQAAIVAEAAGSRESAPAHPGGDVAVLRAQVLQALKRHDVAAARDGAQRLVLQDPRDGPAHLMLALALHLAGDPASLDQAQVAYGAARGLGADGGWASLLAGLAAMERNQPALALEAFAAAALQQPDEAQAFEGLAAAAYAEGRLPLAQAAAERALALSPASRTAWRLAALAAAAAGDAGASQRLMARAPASADAEERTWLARRSHLLVRTAASDAPATVAAPAGARAGDATRDGAGGGAATDAEPLRQLTVDVTLILADSRASRAYGVNLLDGLAASFQGSRSSNFTQTDGGPSSGTVTLTRAIGIPALNYNLNIFNRGNRHYEMLARPTLTAHLGQESSFFVGEQLAVQVSGVNSGSLEKLDVGVSLKLTPTEIRADGATFKISADRSFFSDQGIGTFAQGIATFKQNVSATAEVRFGQTLILSGLTETVSDGNRSRVPLVGEIPGPDLLFSRQTHTQRERSVLVLVTPSRPQGLARGGSTPPAALQRLLRLWDDALSPRSDLDTLVRRLSEKRSFERVQPRDTRLGSLREGGLLPRVLGELQPGAQEASPRSSPT